MKIIIALTLFAISLNSYGQNNDTYLNYCMAGTMDYLSAISPNEVSKDFEKYKNQSMQVRDKICPTQFIVNKKILENQPESRVRYLACFSAMNAVWTLATKKNFMDKDNSDYAVNTCNSFKTREIKSIMGFQP